MNKVKYFYISILHGHIPEKSCWMGQRSVSLVMLPPVTSEG